MDDGTYEWTALHHAGRIMLGEIRRTVEAIRSAHPRSLKEKQLIAWAWCIGSSFFSMRA